jgi:hypothetical protein
MQSEPEGGDGRVDGAAEESEVFEDITHGNRVTQSRL